MMLETFPIQDQANVATADAVTSGEFDLSDYSFQGADFFGFFESDPSRSAMTESVFSVSDRDEMVGIDAGFLFAEMMDDEFIGEMTASIDESHAMRESPFCDLSVAPKVDESLPHVTRGFVSHVLHNPRLGLPGVVSEKVTKGLTGNPASCGMSPRSDVRGVSAPTLAQAVAHIVEYTTVGGVRSASA